MDFEEIGNVASWAVDLANENTVAVSEVIDLYKDMRKNHSNEETKKLVEGIYEVVRGRR